VAYFPPAGRPTGCFALLNPEPSLSGNLLCDLYDRSGPIRSPHPTIAYFFFVAFFGAAFFFAAAIEVLTSFPC